MTQKQFSGETAVVARPAARAGVRRERHRAPIHRQRGSGSKSRSMSLPAQGERLVQTDPAQEEEHDESAIVAGCLSERHHLIAARVRAETWAAVEAVQATSLRGASGLRFERAARAASPAYGNTPDCGWTKTIVGCGSDRLKSSTSHIASNASAKEAPRLSSGVAPVERAPRLLGCRGRFQQLDRRHTRAFGCLELRQTLRGILVRRLDGIELILLRLVFIEARCELSNFLAAGRDLALKARCRSLRACEFFLSFSERVALADVALRPRSAARAPRGAIAARQPLDPSPGSSA